MIRRTIGAALGWLVLSSTTALAQPREPREPRGPRESREARDADGGTAPARKPAQPFALTQVLYSTTELSRMSVRCHSVPETEPPDDRSSGKLQCSFFTVSIAQRAPERFSTLENFSEILRDLRTQCRSATTRTEQARRACAACAASKLTDDCLYVQAMKELKRDCAAVPTPPIHANPAVAALERAEAARGGGAAKTAERFCAACVEDESAACFSRFWHAAPTPPRCTLSTSATELTMQRQGMSMAWTGNLGGACNTQIALSYDDQRRTWTVRQLLLTPEKCTSQGSAATAAAQQPSVYTSAPRYVIADLTVLCERLSFSP